MLETLTSIVFINRLPNVILAHPSISGKYLAENCAMVISISGTSLYEAALYGKPVLTFQDYTYIGELPHVFTINSPKEMIKIKTILKSFEAKHVEKAKTDAAKNAKNIIKVFFLLKKEI